MTRIPFWSVQYAEVVGSALGYDLIGGSSTCASLISEGVAALASLLGEEAPYGTDTRDPRGASALRAHGHRSRSRDLRGTLWNTLNVSMA